MTISTLVPKIILFRIFYWSMKPKRLGITDQKSQNMGFIVQNQSSASKAQRGVLVKNDLSPSLQHHPIGNTGVMRCLENNHNLPKGEFSHLEPRTNFAPPPPPSHLHHLITISQGHHRNN